MNLDFLIQKNNPKLNDTKFAQLCQNSSRTIKREIRSDDYYSSQFIFTDNDNNEHMNKTVNNNNGSTSVDLSNKSTGNSANDSEQQQQSLSKTNKYSIYQKIISSNVREKYFMQLGVINKKIVLGLKKCFFIYYTLIPRKLMLKSHSIIFF